MTDARVILILLAFVCPLQLLRTVSAAHARSGTHE